MAFQLPDILRVERAGRAMVLGLLASENLSDKKQQLSSDVEALVTTSIPGAACLVAIRHAANMGLRTQITLADVNAHSHEEFRVMLEVAGCMDLDMAQVAAPVPFGVCPNLLDGVEPSVPVFGRKKTLSGVDYLKGSYNYEWDGYNLSSGVMDNPFVVRADVSLAKGASAVREIDRLSIEEYGLPGLCLMENAGIGATVVAANMLDEISGDGEVVVLVGVGNNGGDAMVVARGLIERGERVRTLFMGDPFKIKGDAKENLRILEQADGVLEGMPSDNAVLADILKRAKLIIDGIFGTGLARNIEGRAAEVIGAVNRSGRPVLALDLPSGVNADSGEVMGVAVRSDRTVTFAAPKAGIFCGKGVEFSGEIWLADIGCPHELLR